MLLNYFNVSKMNSVFSEIVLVLVPMCDFALTDVNQNINVPVGIELLIILNIFWCVVAFPPVQCFVVVVVALVHVRMFLHWVIRVLRGNIS